MNVLTVSGNLGRDARIGQAGNSAVANFSVAVKSGWGDKEQTVWVDCALFGRQAESKLVDYLKKGQNVIVSGEMGTREYEGKTYVTLRVNTITLGGSRNDSQGGGQQQSRPAPQNSAPQSQNPYQDPMGDDMDDSIPF